MAALKNERLLLKAPFATSSGGRVWMWVEVVSWKGDRVEGILQNDPYYVPGLKAGSRVAFSEADVVDFLHTLPDGTEEGNETGKILMRRDGESSQPSRGTQGSKQSQ